MKLIPSLFFVLVIPFLVFFGKNEHHVVALNEAKEVSSAVTEIMQENADKKLTKKENYNDLFIYMAFQKEEYFTSYLVDIKTGEKKDLLDYVKEEKKEEFEQKIHTLLYLKYPKFIADIVNQKENKKYYQLLDDEFIIYFDKEDIEPALEELLSLRVNYKEVENCFLFTTKVEEKEHSLENGYEFDKNKKAVALTFDDGPNNDKTNKIVDLLEQNKAHATFFMVGNRMEYGKETILNVLNKGNEIGSHSYNHKNMKRMKLEDVIRGEEKTKEIYNAITGKEILYTRVPYGNITNKIKNNLNTVFINWNLDTEDWLHRNKEHIVNYVMENVSDGDIILMHDLYDSTIEAVEELLPKLYAEGYQVVSISELAQLKGKTLENHEVYRSIEND